MVWITMMAVMVTVPGLLITVQADLTNATVYHQSADQMMRVRGVRERWGQVEVRLSPDNPTWYPVCYNATMFLMERGLRAASWFCENRLGLTVSWAETEWGNQMPPNTSFVTTECTDTGCSFSLGSQCATKTTLFIYCPAPVSRDLSLRLTGGLDERRGRLEILRNGQWGTVCDDALRLTAARVACRQMGFDESLSKAYSTDDIGVGNVSLTLVRCKGNESRFIECPHFILGFPAPCKKSAGVECRSSDDYSPRLADSQNFPVANGRLDIKVAGQWRAVCGHVSDNTAKVACREMGLPSSFARVLPRSVSYLSGNIPNINLEIYCRGEEKNLTECDIMEGICNGTFGIVCSDDPGYDIRLVGGDNSTGRLEVRLADIWGTVCNYSVTHDEAKVFCRQLGFENVLPLVWPDTKYRQADPEQLIWLNSVHCKGTESTMKNCHHQVEASGQCSHVTDTVISCKKPEDIDMPMRLVGGENKKSGRLEVFFDGQWGTVCRDFFRQTAATVSCRQMGLPTKYAKVDMFGTELSVPQATGRIWLDNVRCNGSESHILECQHLGIGRTDCRHISDVVIHCQDSPGFPGLRRRTTPSPAKEPTVKVKSGSDMISAAWLTWAPIVLRKTAYIISAYIFMCTLIFEVVASSN